VPEHGPSLFPQPRRRHRVFGGLTERQEHIFTWISVCVILLFVCAWVGAMHDMWEQRQDSLRAQKAAGIKHPLPPPVATPTQNITSALTEPTPPAAYLTDAVLGLSGKVYFTTTTAGQQVAPSVVAPKDPGISHLAVQLSNATFNVITLVPFAEKRGGHIGTYFLGSWPFERGGTPKTPAYANPAGFIEVTRENEDTQISAHFKLRDFITKDQPNVWPKYLLLNPKLLDKLELTIAELEAMGHPVRHVQIMSGFRTPEYNHSGGNPQGRANLSRHMYGDASDIFIDNDGNGVMDDLNGDGRVDIRDAEVILQAAERVEQKYPSLVGGVGVYSACCGHGPFTHIDVRGFRARWRGFGSG